jgi:hypothetical protein
MLARLSSAVAASIVLAGIVAAGGACSSDPDATTTSSSSGNTSSGSSGSSSPKLDSASCNSRCTAKIVTECHAPSDQGSEGCTQTCASGVTEAQATCLEAADCEDLEKLQSGGIDALCPSSGSSSGSSGSTSGNTSSGSTSSGGSNDTPTSLTITATIPSDYKAIHTSSSGKIAALFNGAPQPTFYPNVQINSGHLPLLDKAGSVTLESPDRPDGACGTSTFGFVLNSTQIGVQISGADTLPATDCATFTDSLVNGAKFTLKDVPWSNSTVKATVTIILK